VLSFEVEMMTKRLLRLGLACSGAALAVTCSPNGASAFMIHEDFEGAGPVNSPNEFLTIITPGQVSGTIFNLDDGSIDVLTENFKFPFNDMGTIIEDEQGQYIDTVGARGSGGPSKLSYTLPIDLRPGDKVDLSFVLFGWQVASLGTSASIQVQLGDLFNQVYSVNVNTPPTTFEVPTIMVSSLVQNATLSFDASGLSNPPNVGPFLDDVKLEVTPVPTPALLPGLIGMGAAALRKRKQEAEGEA
jgi:hypothetical protein